MKQIESINPEKKEIKGASDQAIILYEYLANRDSEIDYIGADYLVSVDKKSKVTKSISEQIEPKLQSQTDISKDSFDNDRANYPPVMLIVSPREGQKMTSLTIQLSGVIEDDNGIQSVEIYSNGIPLSLNKGRGIKIDPVGAIKRYEFNERVALRYGKNEIKITAEDISGQATIKEMEVIGRNDKSRVWAVVIGVNQYAHLPHLKYAVKDAHAFKDLLLENKLLEPSNLFFATDEQAALTNLRTLLGNDLKKKAGQDDLVIIYFAGHGATERDSRSQDGDGLEKYLLPYEADPDNLYATALPMREISYILGRINSDRLVFIADACYSGASGGRTIAQTGLRSQLSGDFLDRIASGKGRVIMTASGPNEVSVEDDDLQHGVFTYRLIEALKGKADYDADGFITVDEAYKYVSKHVPEDTEQQQHPVKKGTVEGQLILSATN